MEAGEIAGIGITNQRETTVIWDRASGKPLHNAIVWQDRRTAGRCRALKAEGHEAAVAVHTGLLIDPYFSATKIEWLLDHMPGARARAEKGELAFGTIDSWLIYKLTGGAVHATDVTNASRTLLLDLPRLEWDEEMLDLFGVPRAILPEVRGSADDFGHSVGEFLGKPVAIRGVAGDQQAAMVGQACFAPGDVKSTYGTGCFALVNTGEMVPASHNRLVATAAYRAAGQTAYAIEGSIFIAGAVVQWLRDGLGLIRDAAEIETLVRTAKPADSVYFIPAFTGLGAPWWDPDARGAITGLTRDTGAGRDRPGRPSMRSATRPAISWTRWRATWRLRGWPRPPRSRSMAAWCATTGSAGGWPISLACRWNGRTSPKPRPWARPIWPASAPACFAISPMSPRHGRSTAALSPHSPRPRAMRSTKAGKPRSRGYGRANQRCWRRLTGPRRRLHSAGLRRTLRGGDIGRGSEKDGGGSRQPRRPFAGRAGQRLGLADSIAQTGPDRPNLQTLNIGKGMKFGIGQPVRRTEDIRFITGHGRYTDDIHFEGETHAAFVRSPHAHAKIRSVDTAAAAAAPGVVAVLTQADVEAAGAGPMPPAIPLKNRDGSMNKAPEKPLLAKDKAIFAGEAVAMVVAETEAQAKDAAEMVEVDYEMLDACGTLAAAPTGPQIFDIAPGNLCFDWAHGDEDAVKAAFAKATHTASVTVTENRIAPTSMETRNAIGLYDAASGKYTLYSGSQGAGSMRDRIAAPILRVDPAKLHVITPDVGGGFGMKGFTYPEQGLVLIAAKQVGRPVRWSAERVEAFLADDHGRDMITTAEFALDAQGRILALRIDGTADLGAYLSQFAPYVPTIAGGRIFGGLYRIPATFAAIKGYFTNTAPVDAYRGAGRPEATYMIERLLDEAARVTGIDRVELRLRNMPTPEELPYTNWFGIPFDSGDYPHMLKEGLKRADVAGFAARRAQSEVAGKKRGLGIAYYIEITAANGTEPARVTFTDNGGVIAYVATQSNGQGHETAFAQVVAERLGVPFESITIKQGDTDWVNGFGTAGSRSLNMAGGALEVTSDEVIRKGKTAAGQVLQAGGKDVGFDLVEGVGRFRVAGSDRSMTVPELAVTLRREKLPGFENGLDSDGVYNGAAPTFPNGCHVCEVEVDPETGQVEVVSYSVLDDFGRVINPMLVRGQVHGGIVQGLGQALLENCVYDAESGQLLTASFTDYAMPRALDVPEIRFAYEEFLCKTNPMGAKGCGEAGTVGALAAIVSAVSDAVGVPHIEMPATPEKVWRALRSMA